MKNVTFEKQEVSHEQLLEKKLAFHWANIRKAKPMIVCIYSGMGIGGLVLAGMLLRVILRW